MKLPLAYTWPYALVFGAVFFWAFFPEFGVCSRAGRSPAAKSKEDAGSMRVIMISNATAMFIGFFAAGTLPFAAFGRFQTAAFCGGLSMLAAGALLRRHCFRVLGKFFTGAVAVQQDQAVVDRGAYRFVRHPSYTAGMLMFLGIGIALTNWISVAVLFLLPAAAYAYRVRVEEKALLAGLGEPYRDYMRTRKRFVPFVI